MIDRDELERLRSRQSARRDSVARGEASDGERQATADVDALLSEVKRLAADNDRLARLVADITTIVAESKGERAERVADVIERMIDGADDDGEPTKH